jgi:hypothetical protein
MIEDGSSLARLLLGDAMGHDAQPGVDSGVCYVCGRHTDTGWEESPSENFTAWSQVYRGTVMCEWCRPIFKNRQFRQRSWVACRTGVQFADAEHRTLIWDTLCEPPEPPYCVYITAGGQKQGWIVLGRYPSTSRERFWVGTDWTDRPVLIERAWVHEQAPLLDRMRERKTPKQVLLDGQFSSGAWSKAMAEGWTDDIEAVLSRVGNPRWEVVVRAHP